jgi:hypothetical protein
VNSNHLPFKACAIAAAYALTAGAFAAPMTYTATWVTDVKVGKTTYTNAAVTVRFTGDSNNVQPVTNSHGNPIPSSFCTPPTTWFYLQDQIGGSTNDPIPADAPDQIYYGWDLANYGSLQIEVQTPERE